MFNPDYPLFPIVSFLGFVLPLLPLPWHLRSWNSGTCYYAIWASLSSLNQFINSILWAGDAVNRAPVFCDICAFLYLSINLRQLIPDGCVLQPRRFLWALLLRYQLLLCAFNVAFTTSSAGKLPKLQNMTSVTITFPGSSSLTVKLRNDRRSLSIASYVLVFQ